MKKLKLIRMTNIEYMNRHNVEKKDLPMYIETYSYKSMMFGIVFRDLLQTIKNAFSQGFKKGKK